MSDKISRRGILRQLGSSMVLSGSFVAFLSKADEAAPVCADLKMMDSDSAAMRAKMHYREASLDPLRTCSRCAFFSIGSGGCGTCQMFHGPTNSNGHCDFWIKAANAR